MFLSKKKRFGYVYLIKVKDSGSIFRSSLYKIGITGNLKNRFQSISKSTKDKDRLLFAMWVSNCKELEGKLHEKYRKQQKYFKELEGNGATEVFRLGWADRQDVKDAIFDRWIADKLKVAVFLVPAVLLIIKYEQILSACFRIFNQ